MREDRGESERGAMCTSMLMCIWKYSMTHGLYATTMMSASLRQYRRWPSGENVVYKDTSFGKCAFLHVSQSLPPHGSPFGMVGPFGWPWIMLPRRCSTSDSSPGPLRGVFGEYGSQL